MTRGIRAHLAPHNDFVQVISGRIGVCPSKGRLAVLVVGRVEIGYRGRRTRRSRIVDYHVDLGHPLIFILTVVLDTNLKGIDFRQRPRATCDRVDAHRAAVISIAGGQANEGSEIISAIDTFPKRYSDICEIVNPHAPGPNCDRVDRRTAGDT